MQCIQKIAIFDQYRSFHFHIKPQALSTQCNCQEMLTTLIAESVYSTLPGDRWYDRLGHNYHIFTD